MFFLFFFMHCISPQNGPVINLETRVKADELINRGRQLLSSALLLCPLTLSSQPVSSFMPWDPQPCFTQVSTLTQAFTLLTTDIPIPMNGYSLLKEVVIPECWVRPWHWSSYYLRGAGPVPDLFEKPSLSHLCCFLVTPKKWKKWLKIIFDFHALLSAIFAGEFYFFGI